MYVLKTIYKVFLMNKIRHSLIAKEVLQLI